MALLVALLGAGCAMIFWLVGAFMYLAALKNTSMMYLKRTASITLLAANLELAYACFGLKWWSGMLTFFECAARCCG